MPRIDQYTPVSVSVATGAAPGAAGIVVLAAGRQASDVGLDEAARRSLSALRDARAIPSKPAEVVTQVIDGKPPRRLLVVGLGGDKDLTLQRFREAGGAIAKAARKQKLNRVAVLVDPALAPPTHEIAAALATGLCTGFFKLSAFKGKGKDDDENGAARRLDAVIVVDAPAARVSRLAVQHAVDIATAQNFARAVAAHPGNLMHPPALARLAAEVAREVGLSCRVLDEGQMRKLGMGGLLAVGMGSPQTPPRLIVLEWKGGSAKKATAGGCSLLVGKAITFDTGGVSIKPREGMEKMVYDKCGGMAVLGAMLAIAQLKLPVHVVGLLAAAENHVSSTAYRPGDILRMHNGVTVEITNTDAEGRLVLADALSWGIATFKPAAVVDLATLTGGVVVALGHEFAGIMSNNDDLAEQLRKASEAVGEKTWRLPLGEEVREMMKSNHADMVNSAGRWAHPLQGGEFLRRFVPERVPWVHLDIAGVADSDKESAMYAKGATGWGVPTLVEWVRRRVHPS